MMFAGFIFPSNPRSVRKECAVPTGHVFGPKGVRWTRCPVHHCGRAPGQWAWLECPHGECSLKKKKTKNKTGQSRFQGKCLEEIDKFKYLSFCIFTKSSFKLWVLPTVAKIYSLKGDSNSFSVAYFCFANPGVGTYFSQWFCLRNYFILRASFGFYFFLFERKLVFLMSFWMDL